MEKLGEVQLEKAKFIEKSRERLRELSVPVRNASVSLPLSLARACLPASPRHSSATARPGPDVRRVAPLLLVREQLPELRFDLRAPPRTGRNEFDDEDPGMYD